VLESQRGRLLDAMVHVVADKGYIATTVRDVVEAAGVSRRTFYEQFESKEACFLAAYDFGVEVVLGRLREAAAGLADADLATRVRTEMTTYFEVLVSEPAFAWSLHIEVLAAGPAALRRRAEIFAIFSERARRNYELVRGEHPERPELPDEAFLFLTGGFDELVRECLRTRGAEALPELVEPAVRTTLALFGE
jgi:AcrR family transcriptional regulator